jgi:hypothetical protein
MAKQKVSTSPVPEPTLVDFSEATHLIINKAKMTRKEWDNKDIYVFLDGHFKIHIDGVDKDLIVSDGDMFGEDWYIV